MKVIAQFTFLLIGTLFTCCHSTDPGEVTNAASSKKTALSNEIEKLGKLKKLVDQNPDSLHFRKGLVDALEKSGDLAAAIKQQVLLVQKDSLNALHQYRLAKLQLQNQDTNSAVQSLRKSILLDPDFAYAKLEIGFVYADQKNALALQIADDVLKTTLEPSFQNQARYLKAIYFSNINEKKAALKQLDECIVNDYTFLDAHIEKGIILFDLKRYGEAVKAFEKMQLISSSNAESYYWIGRCYEQLNKKEEAIDYYKKTLGLDETFEDARTALSRLTQ
jgi:tetratricopeptide (TPR) repeat protein